MDLQEARDFVVSDIMQTDMRSVDLKRIDNGILWALNQAVAIAGVNPTATNVAISSSDSTVDLTSSLTNFDTVKQFMSARISTDPVDKEGFRELLRRKDESTTTGQPRKIAFQSASLGHIWPTADAAYTMEVLYCPSVSFKPGTDAVTTLDFPNIYIRDVLAFGVKAFIETQMNDLTSEKTRALFDRRLRQIKGEIYHDIGPRFKSRLSSNYGGYED